MFSRLTLRSVRTNLIAPPIQVYGVSGSYASAAYSAAVKAGEQTAVLNDLQTVSAAFAEKPSVADFFTNPFVPQNEKLAALEAVAGETGMAQTTMGLFGALAENGRMAVLVDVAEVYARILQAEAGEVPCHVSSAIPLSADQTADVTAAISSMLEAGQTPVITSDVNSELLGGMTVSLGDMYTDMKYIDMSVVSKVKKYTELLKEN